jgi:DNA polymerase-3 subunit delta'
MYFKDIIGQEGIKGRLIGMAGGGIIPHALLFSESGSAGGYALALAFARYINCLHPGDEDACGVCTSCRKYDKLAHSDLLFVYPIVKRKDDRKDKPTICNDYLDKWREFVGSSAYFTFDDWRAVLDAGNSQAHIFAAESGYLIRCLSLKPAEAKFRVILIWLPEKMQIECANKLLKVIEEPPEHTLVFMVSQDPENILGTIFSRSQHIHIPPLPVEALPDAEENGIFLGHFQELMRNAYSRQVKNLKIWAESLAATGREEQKSFLRYAQFMLRENFIYRFQLAGINYMNAPETTFTQNFSPFITPHNVAALMEAFANAENDIDRNVNSKFVLFDLALKVIPLVRPHM